MLQDKIETFYKDYSKYFNPPLEEKNVSEPL